MKLHLPKRLLTALLATFAVVASLPTTAWAGSWNNDTYTFIGDDDAESLDTNGHVGTNGTWLRAGAANLNITLKTLTQNEGERLNISGSWNNSTNYFNKLTVENLIIGDGTKNGILYIAKEANGVTTNQYININSISGTLSQLLVSSTGVLQLGTESGTNTFTISAGTIESGGELNLVGGTYNITGLGNSGTVTVNEGSSDVVLNDLVGKNQGKYNPAAITNISTGNLVIENTGNKTLSGDITVANGGTVTLKGGTFGTTEAGLSNKITTESGTFLGLENISVNIAGSSTANEILDADIIVGNGAMLTMTVGDRYSYSNKHTLKVLAGGSVELGSTRQTLAEGFIVELAGGTITGVGDSEGMALDFYNGGTIKVTENSTLDANAGGHDNDATITFDVANGKTLTMNGSLVDTGVTVSNDGIVVYKGTAFTRDLAINKGVFEYNFTGERTHAGNITGAGTLRKSGDGTLRLNSDKTSVTNLAVTAGKLVYTVSEGEKTHSLSGAGGAFEKAGAGTLNLGALKDYSFTGGLTVSEGKVVFAGTTSGSTGEEHAANPPAFVNLVNNLTTVGDAQVEIDGNVIFNYTGENPTAESENVITIDDNIHITGNLDINSYKSEKAPDGDGLRRWNVNEGGNLTIDGYLGLTNKQKMVVNGGNVMAAGGIKLGHSANGASNWTDNSIYSKLVIEDGDVTTSGLAFNGGNNELVMSGGALTFSPTTDGAQVLSGGGTETYKNKFIVTGGTLKATDKSWALTGTTGHVVSLGDATFDIAAGKTITLSGSINLTGSMAVEGAGTLQVGETTWNISAADLKNLGLLGVLDDETQTNGVGSWYCDFITGNVIQQENTVSTIVTVDGVEATIKQNEGGWSLVSTQKNFIINGAFSTTDATSENGAVGADVFVVNKGGTFTVAGDIAVGKTAKELVMGTLGSGNMSLTTDVALSHSGEGTNFGGNLQVESGVTFTLGRVYNEKLDSTSDSEIEYDVDISSLSSLNLNGGTLKMYYVAPHIKSMTVVAGSSGSKISIDDTWADKLSSSADAARIDTLVLNSGLTIETNWKSNVSIGLLTGTGDLTAKQTNSSESNRSQLWIDGLNNYSGHISLTGKINLTLNSGDTETEQAVHLNVVGLAGDIYLNGKVAALLNIGVNESLNASQLHKDSNASITLTGSGVYDLGDNTAQDPSLDGVSLGDEWKGTVSISGGYNVVNGNGYLTNLANLTDLVNPNSKLRFYGYSGYLAGTSTTFAPNIILENNGKINGVDYALNLANGTSSESPNITFNGSISGSGNMLYSWKNVSNNTVATHIFAGDTSQWKGQFVRATENGAGKDVVLKFTKGGDVFSSAQDSEGGILDYNKSGKLHVTVDTADNNSEHTDFYGSIKDVNKLTVNTETTFHKEVSVSRLQAENSQATFKNTLSVGEASISAKDSVSGGAVMSGVVVDSEGIHGTAAAATASEGAEGSTAGGSVQNALIELKNAASYSIENTTFKDVKLSAAQNAIIQLQNVQGDAVLSGGNYVMQAVYGSAVEPMSISGNPTLQYQVAGNWTVDNAQTSTITLTATPGADCGHQLGVYDLVFTLNLDFTSDAVQPTDIDGWKALVTFDGEMATLLEEQKAGYTLADTEEALTMQNPYVMYDYQADTNMLIVTVSGLTVPEPTTATLSLLALAALASRRRRASR